MTTEEPPAVIPATNPEEAPAVSSTDAITEDEGTPAESPESEGAEEAPAESPDATTEGESENAPDVEPETDSEPEQASTDTATDETDESALYLQSSASKDLSGYQWASRGTATSTSQYPGWINPGIKAPNWNTPGATNASGVVAIMDSGIDFTHPDLKNVMYEFSP